MPSPTPNRPLTTGICRGSHFLSPDLLSLCQIVSTEVRHIIRKATHCLLRRALRTFRLDRVTDIDLCSATFRRPMNFDAHSYLQEHMPFIQSDYQIDVWIDMPIEEAERTFAPWRVATEGRDGGTRLRCGRDRLEMFAAMLLSMGCRIVVHSPAELRETFRQLAQRAIQATDESSSLLVHDEQAGHPGQSKGL